MHLPAHLLRLGNRRLSLDLTAAWLLTALLVLPVPSADAAYLNCVSNPSSGTGHCYSEQESTSIGWDGVWIQQNANFMTPGVTDKNLGWFTDSETWLINPTNFNQWVETGLTNSPIQDRPDPAVYGAYWADSDGRGGYWEHTIATFSPDGIQHNQQISHGAQVNEWMIYLDNIPRAPSRVTNFWSTTRVHVGAEVFTNSPLARADNFNIDIRGFWGATPVAWPPQGQQGIAPFIIPGLNGISWGQSQWSWNKP